MDLIKRNISNDTNLEIFFQKMCRVCLEISHGMNHKFTMKILNESSELIIFLRKICELKIIEDEKLPDKICSKCTENVTTAYNLVQLCIASDTTLRNQETRRMLRKIEAEALEEDTILQDDLHLDSNEQKDMEHSLTDELNSENEVCWNIVKEPEYKDIISDKYLCEKCKMSFTNKTNYQKHLKIHDPTKQLKCDHCSQIFSKQFHLNVHLRSHIKKEDVGNILRLNIY